MQEISERMEFVDFVRFPRAIMNNNTLSVSSRLLYAILLDRATLSQRNLQYRDINGKMFCLFRQEDIASIMGKDIKSVRSYMRELETAGLLRKEPQGRKRADRLYLSIPDDSIKPHQKKPQYTETMEDRLVVVYETARKAGFKVDAAFCYALRSAVEKTNAPTVISVLKRCEHDKQVNLQYFYAAMHCATTQEDEPVSTKETTIVSVLEYAAFCGMMMGKQTEPGMKHLIYKYGATAVYFKIRDCADSCPKTWGLNYLKTSLENLTQ